MRFPDDYLWEFPGIYSFVVPYQKTNDFFFSGHLGFSAVAVLEFHDKKRKGWTIYAIVTLIIEGFTMIVLRGHYSIDLISGVIGAHYFFIIGEVCSKIFERFIKRVRTACAKKAPGESDVSKNDANMDTVCEEEKALISNGKGKGD